MDLITTKLEQSRQELLDLSLRNTLLNYRLLKSRGVAIEDEIPQEIYRILVLKGKSMTFLAKPEAEDEDVPEDVMPQSEEPVEESAERHTDRKLQTPHLEAELKKRLLNSYYAARTYVEEQGVNTLYLALGMLEWYEDDKPDVARLAPLILIPVEITRNSIDAPFVLSYTENDIGENLSLHAKLELDFGITLPQTEIDEDFEFSSFFAEVSCSISKKTSWKVNENAIDLGFFSFGTFLMYNDLECDNWVDENNDITHPIMSALLLDEGFDLVSQTASQPLFDENAFVDDHITPQESHQILDADSSQMLAILDVNNDHNLVIQGPPGTGKSQTITNVIAEAVGAGKKVLFVAEKMAALEVVKRRLDSVGIGDACLELHSHKTNKKSLLNELQRTLALGQPQIVNGAHDYETLAQRQADLNQYVEAANLPIRQSEISPYKAFGKLIQIRKLLNGSSPPELVLENSETWTLGEFKIHLNTVNEFQNLIGNVGPLRKHPFWKSQFETFLPQDRRQIESKAKEAESCVKELVHTASLVLDPLSLPSPSSKEDVKKSLHLAQQISMAPSLTGITAESQSWQEYSESIKKGVQATKRIAELHEEYDQWLIPEAWEQNVLSIRQAYIAYGDKWWRIFSRSFRQAKRELTGLCHSTIPKAVETQKELVEVILEAQRLQPEISKHQDLLLELFGSHWEKEEKDWLYIEAVTEWLISVHEDIFHERLPTSVIEFVVSNPSELAAKELVSEIEAALQMYEENVQQVIDLCQINAHERWGSEGIHTLFLSEQQELFHSWQTEVGRMQEIVAYNELAKKMRENGLEKVIELGAHWNDSDRQLVHLVERTWYETLVGIAFKERPILNTFNSVTQEQRIEEFQELDEHQFILNRQQLAHLHWKELPHHSAGGQLGILRREFEKKRRHKPIRQLMKMAGEAIQAIKPVYMMSPMSIAIYLPPESVKFDLVIFDEASQVRPVDAFGAILRGRQAVVVGDSKQLPPTSFFSKMIEDEDAEETTTSDLESILGLFVAQGAPQKMLRWHYRSRHDSLISVSNYEFYDNKLVVFPSPDTERGYQGLYLRHLPHAYYDRGKSRSNPIEAEAVARAVIHHAKTMPELTLGVAAFSTSQMQAVQDALEQLRSQHPETESYFATHPIEPFFVKNLENVQGDERDVIFISVGYGRDKVGHLTMNFGPLNREGGERRLNVLITRARQRCEVFTNLKADDIDLHKTQSIGVKSLKRFLQYAEHRQMEMALPTGREVDSIFEEQVANTLRELGYEVVHQVGSAGFFVDLAVKDPENPGRYLLGIECDGATYHSAQSARDRDRLRQQVLEGLGWRIHRIWSTAWFQNPKSQVERLEEILTEAKINQPTLSEDTISYFEQSSQPIEMTVIERAEANETGKTKNHFYQTARLSVWFPYDIHETSLYDLADCVVEIVKVESPVHKELVMRRILETAGVTRLGSRIQEHLKTAIDIANVTQVGDFLWDKEMSTVPIVRNRENLDRQYQKLRFVAPEEIELAILTAVRNTFGLPWEEIYNESLSLLGLGRATNKRRSLLDATIASMIERKVLFQSGNFVKENKS